MFEHLRRSWTAFLQGSATPEDRRAMAVEMKATLVHARVSVDAMRTGLGETRMRLEVERRELETVRRRRVLAEGIGDAETVRVATRFERQHEERVTVFARKVDVQEAELALADREVAEMTAELRHVLQGQAAPAAPTPAAPASELGPSGAHAAEFDAELLLAALKRRMGK
jgi:hypothetical protein